MTLISAMGRTFLPDFELKRVTFQHRAPADMTWYEKAFGAPVSFNSERNTIVGDLDILSMKRSSLFNAALKRSLKVYLKRKLKHHPFAEKTMEDMVRECLPALLGVKKSNMDFVADSLGVHPKKLQRLLKDEGVTYKDILDETRKQQALRLLADTDMSIQKIATLLDYTSDRPFNIACKRWFGMGPARYRKSL